MLPRHNVHFLCPCMHMFICLLNLWLFRDIYGMPCWIFLAQLSLFIFSWLLL